MWTFSKHMHKTAKNCVKKKLPLQWQCKFYIFKFCASRQSTKLSCHSRHSDSVNFTSIKWSWWKAWVPCRYSDNSNFTSIKWPVTWKCKARVSQSSQWQLRFSPLCVYLLQRQPKRKLNDPSLRQRWSEWKHTEKLSDVRQSLWNFNFALPLATMDCFVPYEKVCYSMLGQTLPVWLVQTPKAASK